MTPFLTMTLAFLAALSLYLAARAAPAPAAFGDAGAELPGWAVSFAAAGVMVAGMGLGDHLALIGRFGLQASHTALGLILAALTALLLQKRLWLAARIAGLHSPGAALGRYYQSPSLRIVMLTLALLFGLPFAANLLSQLGGLLEEATRGTAPRATAIWVTAFFLFLPAVIGGWRATVLVLALQAVLLAVLLPGIAGFAQALLTGPGFPTVPMPVATSILADQIPGVIQFSAGIGKETVHGGIFTGVGIASTALSLIGIVLSPGFLYLGMTARPGRSTAFTSVWLIAALLTGLLLIAGPLLALRMAQGSSQLAAELSAIEPFAGVGFLLLLIVTTQMAVSLFTTSCAILISSEVILPFILPGLSPVKARLTTRITLAICFAMVAALAAFAPLASAVFGSLALPLAVQMLPALLGLTFLRWISRSAVLVGLVFGGLIVLFTEPLGLILFEGLFIDLPWGRWPLTIHSAAWGLTLNLSAVLLISIFTRSGAERRHQDRLHDEFASTWRVDFGTKPARNAKWSLILIWAFFALGPGAILGNTFFSQPIFTTGDASLGIPSLWAWQLFFWLIGVPLVWWLTYGAQLGTTTDQGLRRVALGDATSAPDWIASSVVRVSARSVEER
ncbi:hypothetical protein [Pseudotabrizicola sp. 4114]|uniref:hypothetical protein n=1 Tax=Pseudotabrizicola sp. 4114 TaxID=2817731 RepID=UPI00285A1CA5|nr:Na+/proline symporter [Pseudorhodobacter sp. 4114]